MELDMWLILFLTWTWIKLFKHFEFDNSDTLQYEEDVVDRSME